MKEFYNLLKKKEIKIVFFGDSVTAGYFESNFQMHGTRDLKNVYHNLLREDLKALFPNNKWTIVNAGVGGDTASNALNEINERVIKHNPDIVVVCFGLNDVNGSLDDYRNALNEIVKKLKQSHIVTILLTGNALNYNTDFCPDFLIDYATKTAKIQNGNMLDCFMDVARDIAKRQDVYLCDCYAVWKKMRESGIDTTSLLANGVNHPKREMHKIFAIKLLALLLD